MATLIDSNILIDVLNVGSSWEVWSLNRLAEARRAGPVIINPLILAELAAGFSTQERHR
jgi:predicted nucleic acid-binding protein